MSYLLLESGDKLLLESGDGILLDDGGSIYTRGSYLNLPTTDADLTTPYSGADMTAVATDDNTTYVSQGAPSGQYTIHEFKNDATGKSIATVTWDGQNTLGNTVGRPTILEIYNHNTDLWDELDRDSSALANTDFTLTATISVNLSYYKDTNGFLACRVYQLEP